MYIRLHDILSKYRWCKIKKLYVFLHQVQVTYFEMFREKTIQLCVKEFSSDISLSTNPEIKIG